MHVIYILKKRQILWDALSLMSSPMLVQLRLLLGTSMRCKLNFRPCRNSITAKAWCSVSSTHRVGRLLLEHLPGQVCCPQVGGALPLAGHFLIRSLLLWILLQCPLPDESHGMPRAAVHHGGRRREPGAACECGICQLLPSKTCDRMLHLLCQSWHLLSLKTVEASLKS